MVSDNVDLLTAKALYRRTNLPDEVLAKRARVHPQTVARFWNPEYNPKMRVAHRAAIQAALEKILGHGIDLEKPE